jgi:ParB family chromosome partitioning protein
MVKRGGLGRGLDALMGVGPGTQGGDDQTRLSTLSIELLQRGRFQPRIDMRQDTLQELADSITAQGMVQPIVVRALPAGGYEIVAGERRWRAAQLAGLQEVPVLIRELPDRAAMAVALVENIQREDLNPLEEAAALKRLVEEIGLTHQEVAAAVGRSRAAVSNLLRLLELAEPVQTMLRERRLEMGHARALLPLANHEQERIAQQVERRGLSVRETELLVRRVLEGQRAPAAPMSVDPDIRALQERLSTRLGARVSFQHSTSGKGKLVIHYGSVDELDGILEHLK